MVALCITKKTQTSYGIHKCSTCYKKNNAYYYMIKNSEMENEFAKNKSGVKEKKEHIPKATDWQAYCEINICSTNQ